MNKILVVLSLLLAGSANAGLYYSNDVSATSDTLRVAGVLNVASPSTPYAYSIRLNGTDGSGSFSGSVTASSVTAQAGMKVTGALAGIASGTDNSIGDALGTGANFVGPNETGQGAILKVASNDALGINLGGSIGLGGRYTGTGQATWALIKGLKADATDGNYGGYMSFWTRQTGSGIAERMRITDGGSVGIGTSSPCSTCTLHVAGGASVTGNMSIDGSGVAAPQLNIADPNSAVSINLANAVGLTDSITSSGVTMISRNTSTGKLTLSTNADDVAIVPAANFTVQGSTFTVATTGIVSAPSQPGFSASTATVSVANDSFVSLVFETEIFDRQDSHAAGVFTVPTGAGGLYLINCYASFSANATGSRDLRLVDGGVSVDYGRSQAMPDGVYGTYLTFSIAQSLSAGDTRKCQVYQNSGGALNLTAGRMDAVKLW